MAYVCLYAFVSLPSSAGAESIKPSIIGTSNVALALSKCNDLLFVLKIINFDICNVYIPNHRIIFIAHPT